MASIRERSCFIRNTNYGYRQTNLYLWCPDTDITAKGGIGKSGNIGPSCTATKGSQGYDNLTGYVYELIVVNGIKQDLAYVECNYVQ